MTRQSSSTHAVDRFVEEQIFEEDVRAVLQMMRPNRRERLLGWNEYRTGAGHFRITVAWDPEYNRLVSVQPLIVPNMAEVIESLIVGSAKHDDTLTAQEEFELYRDVVHNLLERLNELQSCYE